MGNDGTCEEGNSSIQPGGTAIKLNKDVEFKVYIYLKDVFSNHFLYEMIKSKIKWLKWAQHETHFKPITF